MLRVTRNQLQLFTEVIDTVVTCDRVSDAGAFVMPPPGLARCRLRP